MTFKQILLSLLLMAAFGIASCDKSNPSTNLVSSHSNETVLDWNRVAFEAFGGVQYQHSLMASRINAMMHLSIHDALNGIEEKYQRYAFHGRDEEADPIAAAASAAYTVLLHEIPSSKGMLDSALAKSIGMVADGAAKTRGISLGQQAGAAVIAKRAHDGSNGEAVTPVPPSTQQPGLYQGVPPFNIIFAPTWENVRPFALTNKSQFRSAAHPAINSPSYAIDFEEVKKVGQRNSSIRTPDQSTYAKFWYEFSEAGWNRVTRNIVIAKKLNLLEAARTFALVDMAMADAYIAGWESKLYYNFWRPYTAVRNAANDGNEETMEEAGWEPAEPTPPIQDYPSTHSALGNAAATVLTKLFGANTAFSTTSNTSIPVGMIRHYTSFYEAADENADSRVMAGIHFRFSCEAGQTMGNNIGDWVIKKSLTPIK